jgi:hypothetical protein
MSPVEKSRSRSRLWLSATPAFVSGPVRIDASNTDEALSVSFERVYAAE